MAGLTWDEAILAGHLLDGPDADGGEGPDLARARAWAGQRGAGGKPFGISASGTGEDERAGERAVEEWHRSCVEMRAQRAREKAAAAVRAAGANRVRLAYEIRELRRRESELAEQTRMEGVLLMARAQEERRTRAAVRWGAVSSDDMLELLASVALEAMGSGGSWRSWIAVHGGWVDEDWTKSRWVYSEGVRMGVLYETAGSTRLTALGFRYLEERA